MSSEPRPDIAPFPRLAARTLRVVGSLLAACVALPIVFAPDLARADGGTASVPDPAAAALFQAGRDLVDSGDWKEGCAKFEASMILYPAASTLLNIARCYEHDGKLALAWSAYQRALVINRETQGAERKKALEDVAQKGLAQIEPRLPRIRIEVKGGAPSGLRITHNGKDVPEAMLGTQIPVDPGSQSISADAPGYEPFMTTVDASEGKVVDVAVELASEGSGSGGGARMPVWAWAAGGAGVVLLAGAAVFRADQAYIEGKQIGLCGEGLTACPSREAYDPDEDNARKNRDNALFIGLGVAGGAALGAAVVGLVIGSSRGARSSSSAMIAPTPWIGAGVAGMGIGGRF